MSEGLVVTESDEGTKEKLKQTIKKDKKEIAESFEQAMENWWEKVWETARNLCIEYGAIDTWTLWNSIRIEDVLGAVGGTYMGGPAYEVMAGPEVQAEITKMIVAGGGGFINPKTGKECNYAESVHEGTGKNIEQGPRPFLSDAINQNMAELDAIIAKFLKEIEGE